MLTRRTPSVTGGFQRSSTMRSRSAAVGAIEQLAGAGDDRLVVLDQRLGALRPNAQHLVPRVAVAGVVGISGQAEPARPVAGDPQLILLEDVGDVIDPERG